MNRGLGFVVAACCVMSACGGDSRGSVTIVQPDRCNGFGTQVLCDEGSALHCVDGGISTSMACGTDPCVQGLGCQKCVPNLSSCDGNKRSLCSADGSTLTFVEECAAPLSCSVAGCFDLCADAAANRSYLGCDYWPVFTSNSQLDPAFTPAVGIGNGNLVAAHVVITKGGVMVQELDVPPSSAQTVTLAFQPELERPGGSRIVRAGAYHLTSSVPVTVHQYNPLQFRVDQACSSPDSPGADAGTGTCYSYTNDASLLFPSTALAQDPKQADTNLHFTAASRSSFVALQDGDTASFGGFVTVVAVGDKPANVTITTTAHTQPSGPDVAAGDAIASNAPGDVLTRTLQPGDVLQLMSASTTCTPDPTLSTVFCDPGVTYDLTGTQIDADAPVQVISGHDCANVPFNRTACDHLEESMVPLHAWGNTAVLSLPSTSTGSHYMLRVISGADNNAITFDPPLHDPITLNKNQSLEFVASDSTFVHGTGRFMLAEYFLGQQELSESDPSMTIAVPIDQYRTAYNFISPATYDVNFVDIIATTGDVVTLDGKVVTGFRQVGSSKYSVATNILDQPGAHEIHGTKSAGIAIVLYGVAPFTAYLLPGGLDLYPIEDIGI